MNIVEASFKKLFTQEQLTTREKGLLEKEANLTLSDEGIKSAIPSDIILRISEGAAKEHPILKDIFETFSDADVLIPRIVIGDGSVTTDDLDPLHLEGHELDEVIEVSKLLSVKLGESSYDYIMHRLTTLIADAKARTYIYGNGSTEATGMATTLKNTENYIEYSNTGLTYEELLRTTNLIASKFSSGAKIYANKKTIFTELANIVDANGHPVFKQEVLEDVKGQALGFLVVEESTLKDGDILVGNVNKGYHVNSQEELSVMIEEKNVERKRVISAVQITDGGVLSNEAFTFYSRAAE